MENEPINRTIHEKVLNKCWHEFAEYRAIHGNDKCLKGCGGNRYEHHNPAYCNDLNATREAEVKVVEKYGRERYAFALLRQMDMAGDSIPEGDAVGTFQLQHVSDIALAPARTRCEAIIALLEEMEDDKN